MARSFALRVAAATLVAATTTVGLSAWISGTSAAPVTTLAGKLSSGAGATLLVERGDDHESRIIAGEGPYASIVETAEHSGGVCQSRDGYRNADPAGLSPLVSRYSVTRCDLDDV